MIDVIYMILRRLRVPLIILIAVYAISIFGLAIAPGVDPDGNPWRMGFFHATYVMSYTATTIGFGELPFPFSDQQRAWLIITIYMSVMAWTYAVGSVFAMTTDRTFRRTVARNVFRWQVKRLSEPSGASAENVLIAGQVEGVDGAEAAGDVATRREPTLGNRETTVDDALAWTRANRGK